MKKSKILALSLVCTFSSLQPMQSGRFFSRFCTLVNLGLAGGPCLLKAYKIARLDTTFQRKLDDADPVTTALVREELARVGVQTPEEITVKSGDPFISAQYNSARAGRTTILVPYQWCNIINNRPEQPDNKLFEYYLGKVRQFRSVMQHEGNHIKYQDLRSFAIFAAVIPFVTHPALKGGALILQRLAKFRPAKSKVRLLGRNIGAGWLKSTANVHLLAAYSRNFEQRADDGVVDPEGLAHFLQGVYYSIPNEFQREFFFGLDIYHPHPLKRIAKLEERTRNHEKSYTVIGIRGIRPRIGFCLRGWPTCQPLFI